MRDDVVQLPGDPRALLGGGELGLPLQLDLQRGGPALDGGQPQRALPDERAERPGQPEVEERIDDLERLEGHRPRLQHARRRHGDGDHRETGRDGRGSAWRNSV